MQKRDQGKKKKSESEQERKKERNLRSNKANLAWVKYNNSALVYVKVADKCSSVEGWWI